MSSPIAFVTGSSRRVGRAICIKLHELGFHVLCHYRHQKDATLQLVASLNEQRPHSATAMAADLTKTEEFNRLITDIKSKTPHLDLIVNNASIFERTPLDLEQQTAFNQLMQIHTFVPWQLCTALLPLLQNAGAVNPSQIINITDFSAEKPLLEYELYCASKAALKMLTQGLAKRLAPNVRVNAIAPGNVAWPEGDNALTAEQQSEFTNKTALKTAGAPEDIAEAVAFLVSAHYVTGQTLHVTGGKM